MAWIEEPSSVKFVNWGKLKNKEDKDVVIVVKEGESIEGRIEKMTEEFTDGEVSQVKYRLAVKGEEMPVIVWSNSAILRQHKVLLPKEGEKVRFTYIKDYPTKSGQKGRDVRLAIDR